MSILSIELVDLTKYNAEPVSEYIVHSTVFLCTNRYVCMSECVSVNVSVCVCVCESVCVCV